MRTRPGPIESLRTTIDCLPVETRRAMLDGVRSSEIIVGGYTDGRGGVCPMLAAHRRGGRTSFLSFAHAWDRVARAARGPRRASERELRILTGQLEASLLAEEHIDLGSAIREHAALRERHSEPVARRPRPGDPDRRAELRRRPGWAWLRAFRRYDDYAAALDRVDGKPAEGEPAELVEA